MKPFLIAVLAFVAYSNSFSGPFLFDDHSAIKDNVHLRQLWPPWACFKADPGIATDKRPVVSFSFALNYAMHGYKTKGYHAINFIIHLLAALTLFALLNLSFQKTAFSKNAPWLSFMIASIWCVHPLLTECVTYISTRTSSLMGLFYLLTFYFFIKSLKQHSRNYKIASLLCCYLGMGSKEIMLVAPILLLIYDKIFITGSFKKTLEIRKKFYIALSGSYLVLATSLLMSTGWTSLLTGDLNSSYADLTFSNNFLTQSTVLLHYLKLSFDPRFLNVNYAVWPLAQHFSEVWIECLLVLSAFFACLFNIKKYPRICYLGISFFFIIAPTTLIPQKNQLMAERHMYLPLIFVICLVVLFLSKLSEQLSKKNKAFNYLLITVGISLIVFYTQTTWERNKIYQSKLAFWQSVIQQEPKNYKAHCSLGAAYFQKQQFEKAKSHYETSTQLNPHFSEGWLGLGNIAYKKNQLSDAWKFITKATNLYPTPGKAHVGLGNILSKKKLYAQAELQYRKALELDYTSSVLYMKLADSLIQQNKTQESLLYYKKADALDPNNSAILINWAAALAMTGSTDEAITLFKKITHLQPIKINAYTNLAILYVNKNQHHLAKNIIEEGLQRCQRMGRQDLVKHLKQWKSNYSKIK